MSTEVILEITTQSSDQTETIGASLGRKLRGGEVIELVADLGGGKTTFVKGLVRGAGSADKVASPSFMISKLYKTDKFEIHHVDLYRLGEAGILDSELAEVVGDQAVVLVVEWADLVHDALPGERLIINIKPLADSENHRSIEISCPEKYAYLIEGIKNV